MSPRKTNFCMIFMALFCSLPMWAQTVISGVIKDRETGQPMIGVSVMVEGTFSGTVTDLDGSFYLITKEVPPFLLDISYISYERRKIEIVTSGQEIKIDLVPRMAVGREVVISASRISEDMLLSPITVEKIDGIELRSTPTPSAYGALANLRGVQMNTSSLTFTSINTRGFADIQNWRFIQSVDGIEMNAPGLNYPVGAISAPSDIDVASMELVPGAGSALYGANAFNGMLLMNSKDPFNYQGLSAEFKGGITSQDAAGINPFGVLDIRYAKAFKNKLAFKVAVSALRVNDWESNDSSFHITNEIAAAGAADLYANLDRYDPAFNAVNMYGDESSAGVYVNLGDTSRVVNRTGFKESDLVDYNQQVYKANASLHYRITDKLEASYDYRIVQADAVLRHTTIYPMVNLVHQVHKAELKGTNFYARSYFSTENSGDSYYLFGTGAYIQQNLKSNSLWGADYGAAYRGEITGIPARDHQAARAYADSDMPGVESDTFQTLLRNTKNNPNYLTGGSRFVDRSSFIHAEGNYDFTNHWDVIKIQAGASFRRYNLVSDGSLFNDGAAGYNGPIGIHEYGGFVQASKVLFKDILALRASVRYDKNQNFVGRITPRASILVAFGKERNHNIRASFQTGFRNPATQEAFIALDLRQGILLGGLETNLENYNYVLPSNNFITGMPAGTAINGVTIHDSLVSLASFGRFAVTGNPGDLNYLNLPTLKQEHITTYEFGYRTLLNDKFYIDAYGYYNQYDNFVTRVSGYSVQALRAFGVYSNIKETITSIGGGLQLEYILMGDYKISANYAFTTFNADTAIARNPGFLPSFNTPKHRVNFSISNRNVWKNIGFNVKYRWSDSYVWQSPFGAGTIDAYHAVDAAVVYQIPKASMSIKLGGTNLLMKEYKQVYGGPMVGTQAYIGISYDPVVYKNAVSRTKYLPRTKIDKSTGDKTPKDNEPKKEVGKFQRF